MIKNIIKSKGVKLALITAVISGVSVFFNKFAVTKNINPYQFTTLKNILVALILSLLLLTPIVFKQLRQIKKNDWIKLILIGIIGGSIPFLLFFKGLSLTTAVSAGFIHKTLLIWVVILAVIFLKEKTTILQYLALGILFIGNLLLGGFSQLKFGYPELIILVATILWSIENVIAKKVLKNIDPKIVAWSRMFFGSVILFIFIMATSGLSGVFTLDKTQWGWIFISVIFLSSYVISWYHALKFEKASVVASILVLASPITTMINAIYVNKLPDFNIILATSFIVVGIILFIIWDRNIKNISNKCNAEII